MNEYILSKSNTGLLMKDDWNHFKVNFSIYYPIKPCEIMRI